MLFCLCAQRPDPDGENRHTARLLFRKGILTACHVAHERGERIELFRPSMSSAVPLPMTEA